MPLDGPADAYVISGPFSSFCCSTGCCSRKAGTAAQGMRVWRKKAEVAASAATVARAALAGASREELLREALRILAQGARTERVGIWLEPGAAVLAANPLGGIFHGVVWDRTAAEGCPPEWKVLSLEPPLPEQLLVDGRPFEQDLAGSARHALIGPLVGLRRALWAPVAGNQRARRKPTSGPIDRKSTRLNSSHEWISYAVFCLKKKKKNKKIKNR